MKIPSTPASRSRSIVGHVVDGPDVYVIARAVDGGDQLRGQRFGISRPSTSPVTGICSAAPGVQDRGKPGEETVGGHPHTAGRGRHPPAEPAAQAVQPADAERGDADPVVRLVLGDRVGQQIDGGGGLGVDVEPGVREGLNSSLSRGMGSRPWIRASATSVYGSSRDRAGAVGDPVQLGSWKASSTPSAVACTSVSR